ncbi:S-formylglutathione hydrolase [Saitozyma sp. JCM 24511]|nr:S-formylglutathione hydrolase [Saitozyma sp. JCM 24511]
MVQLEKLSSNRVSTGTLTKYSFPSRSLSLPTQFNIFIPSSASAESPVPVLWYLAGLTCSEDTGPQKGGFLNPAGEQGVAVVFPDTSPRGAGVQGEEDDWQLGTGAGFYINATNPKWAKYRMYDLITKELPEVLKEADLGLDLSRMSIMGHSMGGHGALMIYLKNPGLYRSASAFAPACNPSVTPWGINAFSNYLSAPAPPPASSSLKEPPAEWLAYDSSHLLKHAAPGENLRVLVDVGTEDKFLKDGQLEPAKLEEAAQGKQGKVEVRLQKDFDHSYYFISTFSPEHIAFHAKALKA